ncbi:MAG: hypothetical protein HF978_08265 [Desulfobacteraceae bacterium]|nr:hypothetical protein [Desulfobacteraceae bacterium]MBC2755524.1 hypothetical protein [Desulfobacteraceae bacterium]
MLKKRLFGIFVFFCLIAAANPAYAEAPDYQLLMDFLNQSFPDQYQVLANISAKNRDRFVFPQNDLSLAKGQELLVLEQQAETPVYLLSVIGVLQIEGLVDHSYVARQIAAWGETKPGQGDPIVIPASPTIYLYTNIKAKDGFAPYRKLLQELIRQNYEVKEIDSPEFAATEDKYGVLLRLEGSDLSLTTKLQSLYSGATMFSEAQSIEPDCQVSTSRPQQDQDFPAQTKDAKNFQKADPDPNIDLARQILRLPENFNRLVICQIDPTEELEFALLNNDKIQIFHYRADELEPAYAYEFKTQGLIDLHLHAMDLTGDGLDELIVTMGRQAIEFDARTTKISSRILSFKENRLTLLAGKLPYYLRVIGDSAGKPILLGQKKGEYEPYSGDIFEICLKSGGDISTEVYGPASGIYSVYQFSFIPEFVDNIMILEPSDLITVYHGDTKKIAAVTDTSFGRFNIVPYPIRREELEFIGGFNDKKTFAEQFAPRRFLLKQNYDSQIFTINKQRKTYWNMNRLKNIFSNQKAQDNLVAVKWTGQHIRQTWESEKLSKDILDFSFMPGENRDVIFVLIRDAQGFALQKIE